MELFVVLWTAIRFVSTTSASYHNDSSHVELWTCSQWQWTLLLKCSCRATDVPLKWNQTPRFQPELDIVRHDSRESVISSLLRPLLWTRFRLYPFSGLSLCDEVPRNMLRRTNSPVRRSLTPTEVMHGRCVLRYPESRMVLTIIHLLSTTCTLRHSSTSSLVQQESPCSSGDEDESI